MDSFVTVYTDGACSGNPGPCAAAACMMYNGKTMYLSEYLGIGTNNIAELTAVKIALVALKRKDVPIRVHSDSTYVIGVLSQNWKAKENRELIAEIKGLLAAFQKVQFVKVPGHAGVPENERVDQLARDAVSARKGIREIVGKFTSPTP